MTFFFIDKKHKTKHQKRLLVNYSNSTTLPGEAAITFASKDSTY